ncbi:PrsW family intramembrane metalloprotease [Corynebacterium sp. 13CS0277]|uniref:PrsW family intramembrane metalloprotease n=1 Tax=Corynebacterium sp. 13CS0277 TaxID=2071994 RepID=UPI000D027FF8|nr:PrsW family intramembrane metalloprotease [Corynebacterium sp. 13CS0277]PRQ10383.1 PrsW family intramembrane metalloprotease [Corynebacterium sp. 13CS0277]
MNPYTTSEVPAADAAGVRQVPRWAQQRRPHLPERRTASSYLLQITAILAVVGGAVVVAFYMLAQVLLVPAAGMVSLAFVAVWVLVIWLITRRFPGFRFRLALRALAWGAAGSMLLVAAGGDAWLKIANSLGIQWASMSFAGAYPEEIAKGAGVFMLLWLFGKRPWEGLIYGMWVGLGFELLENYLYGISGAVYDANSDLHGVLWTWGLRSLLGPGLHVVLVGFVGYGLGQWLFGERSRWWYVLVGFLGHFVWNMQLGEPGQYFIVAGVMLVLYPWFVVVVRRARAQAVADAAGGEYQPTLYQM